MATIFEKITHHFSQKVKLTLDKSESFRDHEHSCSWRLTLRDRHEVCTVLVEKRNGQVPDPVLIKSLRITPSAKSGLEPGGGFQHLYHTPSPALMPKQWQMVGEMIFACPATLMDRCRFDVSFRDVQLYFGPYDSCVCRPRSHDNDDRRPTPSTIFATLSADLSAQFLDESTSDVTFAVDDRLFPAHKWILCARLVYFRNMFASEMLEATTGRVCIEDTDPESFRHLLRFIYCGQLPDNISAAASSLLPLADRYGVDQLKAVCVANLHKSLEKSNAVKILLLAELHGCPHLKKTCIKGLRQWRDDMEPEEFEPLKQHPDLLVEIITCMKKQKKPRQAGGQDGSDAEMADADDDNDDDDDDNDDDNRARASNSAHDRNANDEEEEEEEENADSDDDESVHVPLANFDSDAESVRAAANSDSDEGGDDEEELPGYSDIE